MSQLKPDWPPPYKIRVSARSKRMALRISRHNGLEVVIPKRTSKKKALQFLNLKYDWIQKHRHLLQAQSKLDALPTAIHLPTINECWQVDCVQYPIDNVLISIGATHTIILKGNNSETFPDLLKKWLHKKAKKHLTLLISHYSKLYQLPYQSVKFRYQRSRWGSCTKDKNINLNCKLLLLPIELTHYVIVHELMHTIHFDHSPMFWNAVEKIIPNQKELRHQLKTIEQQLPNWLY